jgi:lipopolysaccharide biosynthesis glycosyltransferase
MKQPIPSSALIKIFVCMHEPGPYFQSDCIIPIHAGRALSLVDLGLPGDDTGDNISQKNAEWCELTVLYWMWKNIKADYYGLFHYRRYLNFRGRSRHTSTLTGFGQAFVQKYGYDDTTIRTVCANADILIPPIYYVHPVGLPSQIMTGYDFFCREHNKKDLDQAIDLIKTHTPRMYPSLLRSLYSNSATFWNIAIMCAELFQEYCAWLFSILAALEKELDTSSYDAYQKRVYGFLAERLLNAFVDYARFEKAARVRELGILLGPFAPPTGEANRVQENIKKRAQLPLYPACALMHVAFAIDENYAQHCAVAVCSILEHLHPEQKICFYILHCGDLAAKTRAELAALADNRRGTDFKFPTVDKKNFCRFPQNRKHISMATWYRLALHKVLPPFVDKVIYLDADIVVMDSLTKLWEIEVDNYFVAGAPDEGGVLQNRRLGLPATHIYINAGVCIFNIRKLRAIDADTLFLETLYKNFYNITLQDQDIINLAFKDKIFTLPLCWNANSRLYTVNILDHSYSYDEAIQAANNPSIIHFTDSCKPWQALCAHPLKYLYFLYFSKTKLKLNKLKYICEYIFSYAVIDDYVMIVILCKRFCIKKFFLHPIYRACHLFLRTIRKFFKIYVK